IEENGKQLLLFHNNDSSNSNTSMTPNVLPLDYLTQQNLFNDIKEEINVSKAILHAEAELAESTDQLSDEEINDDWLYKWRNYAGEVSSDEVQSLWGKLLAGEVKKPGSFSLRTLDFLRSLSHEEALKIEKLAKFVFNGAVFRDKDFLDKEGASYGFLLEMQEIGLLSGVETIGMTMSWGSSEGEKFSRALVSHQRLLLVTHNDPAKTITLPAYSLTFIGKQIMSLIKTDHNENYLKIVCYKLIKDGFDVRIADVKNILPDGQILYENGIPVKLPEIA
ncbi:MAG TPA: DUF2806 domain-containing protein, partial [Alphaproteobacteria bacterium]